MVVKISDNILSPLGQNTAENYRAVKAGKSGIKYFSDMAGVHEPFWASIIPEEMIERKEGHTRFESMCIQTVEGALSTAGIDPSSERVLFILSTTKGNIRHLSEGKGERRSVLLGDSAKAIARYFGNGNTPITVSNACISGVCAQICAMRALRGGKYDYVIVVGADEQTPFIITGFQSLKALSPEVCKPFDKERRGLNLGEAAATIIYSNREAAKEDEWELVAGAIRNDANHISGPSRTGEGSYLTLRQVLQQCDSSELAFINAHGTATLYNDEMESIAITRAELREKTVNSMKGYYGHTMGAAGVMETILSMTAIDDHTILGTYGFETLGVTQPIKVERQHGVTDKKAFIKLISGFGGCNAAALYRKGGRR